MDLPNCNANHSLIRKLSDVNFSLARERGEQPGRGGHHREDQIAIRELHGTPHLVGALDGMRIRLG